MVRMICIVCQYEWARRSKMPRGQLIRCPSCRRVLEKLSKPIKPHVPNKYISSKAIDEYAKV